MKTFVKWCEKTKRDLPAVAESQTRTGISDNYPPAYVRGQYPGKYFNPTKATADLDLQQKASKTYGGQKAAN